MTSERKGRIGAIIFGGVFFAAALACIAFGAHEALQQGSRISRGIQVEAEIVSVRLDQRQRRSKKQTRTVWTPVVVFRYEADGATHEAQTPYPRTDEISSHAIAQAVIDRFPVGQRVPAWYVAESPDVAYLIREPVFTPYAFMLFPLLHGTVGLLVIGGMLFADDLAGKRRRAALLAVFWNVVTVLALGHFLMLGGSLSGWLPAIAATLSLGVGAALAWYWRRCANADRPVAGDEPVVKLAD